VIGNEIFEDDAVAETAKVYSQSPSADQNEFYTAGQPVNLVYRDPDTFNFEEYLEQLNALDESPDIE
jgi:hypothetical protein